MNHDVSILRTECSQSKQLVQDKEKEVTVLTKSLHQKEAELKRLIDIFADLEERSKADREEAIRLNNQIGHLRDDKTELVVRTSFLGKSFITLC